MNSFLYNSKHQSLYLEKKNSAILTLVANMQREIGKTPPHTCFGKEQTIVYHQVASTDVFTQFYVSSYVASVNCHCAIMSICNEFTSHILGMLTHNLRQFMPNFV